MNNTLNRYFLITYLTLFSCILRAQPLMSKEKSLSINWSTLKLRFSGVARPKDPAQNKMQGLGQLAVNNALLSAKKQLLNYHTKYYGSYPTNRRLDAAVIQQNAESDTIAVTHSSYIYNTTIYKDSTVLVDLENSLSNALKRNDVLFKIQKKASTDGWLFSGLVLRTNKYIEPLADYRILDSQTKEVLHDITYVAREVYERHLMGRWFIDPRRTELVEAVGTKAVSVQATIDSNGDFLVQRAAWQEAIANNPGVLTNSRIAVALPQREIAQR